MSHSSGNRKQVGIRVPGRNAAGPQERPDRLCQIVQIEFRGAEEPRNVFRRRRQGLHIAGKPRIISAALSHGRVLSTPTTMSALRSMRCPVAFRALYTQNEGRNVRLRFYYFLRDSPKPHHRLPFATDITSFVRTWPRSLFSEKHSRVPFLDRTREGTFAPL
jgi:hypothetical protein